jgi:hypothetical protein
MGKVDRKRQDCVVPEQKAGAFFNRPHRLEGVSR